MTKEQADQILKELEMLRKLKILEMVEKGHSQVALAQLLGLSQPTISRMVLAHPLHLLKKRFHIFVFHGALIVRIENDGSVRDRSRYLYRKDPSVRKYRENIIRLADNRRAAARVPTKRRPLIQGLQGIKTTKTITRQELRRKKPLNVLYLTANPDPAHSLRVGVEVRQVQDAVRGSPYRDNIALQYRPAADLNSLIEGLNDYRPRIVHFSGHGDSSGIAVDNPEVTRRPIKIVSFDLLAKALSATDVPPEIVVLNACESAGARKALLPPAKIVIVMRDSVSDLAATAFAAKFYAAIAAGQSVKSAFAQGKVAIEMVSLNEADTPDLLAAPGANPAKVILT